MTDNQEERTEGTAPKAKAKRVRSGAGESTGPKAKAKSTGAGPSESAGAGSTGAEESTGAGEKKSVEDRLDDVAERFSRVMSDGVKRMEGAFERGMENLKRDEAFGEKTTKVTHFFQSSTGGVVLILLGFVWFFYTIGWFDSPIFPILLIVIGFFMMQKYRSR
jgi:hypothetical protein